MAVRDDRLLAVERGRRNGLLVLVADEAAAAKLCAELIPALAVEDPGVDLKPEHIANVPEVFVVREPGAVGDAFALDMAGRLKELRYTGKALGLALPPECPTVVGMCAADPERFGMLFRDLLETERLKQTPAESEEKVPKAERNGPVPISAADLVKLALPEPRFAVPELLPEGLSILAGRPKMGKSWLALGVGLAVASGGVALSKIQVVQGGVLYLALEDSRRRLQDRLGLLLARLEAEAPEQLYFETEWPRFDEGGVEHLEKWLEAHDGTRLVIIDIWAKCRPKRGKTSTEYEDDYAHACRVKAIADRFHIAVLILYHCRKLPADDPVDSISGTLGASGAADAVLILQRKRGQFDATLFITGRDIEERELALRFDREFASWFCTGEASEMRATPEQQKIIQALSTFGRSMTPKEIETAIGKKSAATKMMLGRMLDRGLLVSENGSYSLPARDPCDRSDRRDPGDSNDPDDG